MKAWPRSAALWGLLCGAAVAGGLAACASRTAPRSEAPATAEPAVAGAGVADPRRNDITVLWSEIRRWRVEAGWSAEPAIPRDPAIVRNSVEDLRVCPNDPNPDDARCLDTCKLKDAICDNAEQICRIAGDLGEDTWANEKCESAKTSCKEATEKCCGCASEAPSTAPATP